MDNSYAKATEVLKRNQVRIMRIRGVNGIGIGRGSDYGTENKPCLVIYVEEGGDKRKIPKHIENIPVIITMSEGFTAKRE